MSTTAEAWNDEEAEFEEGLKAGEPPDVEGECNAHLYIGDNFGDNHATMRCALKPGHEGNHVETYERIPEQRVTVSWTMDEKSK